MSKKVLEPNLDKINTNQWRKDLIFEDYSNSRSSNILDKIDLLRKLEITILLGIIGLNFSLQNGLPFANIIMIFVLGFGFIELNIRANSIMIKLHLDQAKKVFFENDSIDSIINNYQFYFDFRSAFSIYKKLKLHLKALLSPVFLLWQSLIIAVSIAMYYSIN
jgi:hypothetical protein